MNGAGIESRLAGGVQGELLGVEEMPDEFFRAVEEADPDRPKYTAQLFFRRRPQDYRRTVQLLGAGLDLREIARMMRVHHRTVAAVRDSERAEVDTYKQRVINNLRVAVEVLSGSLADSVERLPLREQPVAFGILVDKLAGFEGEPSQRIEHTINVRLTHDAVAQAIAALPAEVQMGDGARAELQKGDGGLVANLALPAAADTADLIRNQTSEHATS